MGTLRFEVGVPTGFRLDLTVWALRRRAHNAIDRWDGIRWARSLATAGGAVELTAAIDPSRADRLVVTLEQSGRTPRDTVLTEARDVVNRALGLEADIVGFAGLAEADPTLEGLARRFRGLRPPRFPGVFEALVNAVACQQLSLVVGITLLNRLSERFGPAPRGSAAPHAFPTPARLADADPREVRELGFSGAKARSIVALGERVVSGALDVVGLEGLGTASAGDLLLGLPGIGRWSAEYTLLRGLGHLEVLPGDDVGARNNLRRNFGLAVDGYDELADLSQQWWPLGGFVYFHLLLDSLDRQGCLTPPAESEP